MSRKLQDRTVKTRNVVLAAAVQEFAEKGIAGARIDKIAKRARVNKQALYYHFGDKERLFRAALSSVYEQFRVERTDLESARSSPVDSMKTLVAAIFDHVRDHEDGTAIIGHENRLHGDHLTPNVRKLVRRAVAPMISAISTTLKRGQTQGSFSRTVDPIQLYLTIISLCMFNFTNAFTLSAIVGRDLLSKPALVARKQHVISFVLAGLRADDSQNSTKRLKSRKA
jgi:TetR/AcrR family transcriptional regulator